MTLYKEERTALFIDGPNLYSSAKGLQINLDYGKILNYFEERCRLQRAFYYTSFLENVQGSNERIAIRPLIDWLDYNGYHLVTKPAKQYEDQQGNLRTKANMDVEIAVDMIQSAPNLDHIVLFSGDGDFRYLVEACQRHSRVTVISTVKTSPPMCADSLRRQADTYLDLYDLRGIFQRDNQGLYRGLQRTDSSTDLDPQSDQPTIDEEGDQE